MLWKYRREACFRLDKGGNHVKFDIESIRFQDESDCAEVLRQLPAVDALAARVSSDPVPRNGKS